MVRTNLRIVAGDPEPMKAKLDEFEKRAKKAIALVFQYWALKATNEMKTNAPWTDRTANARNGLIVKTQTIGNVYDLHFISTMSYGVWLEIRWSGRYAVIGPTMISTAPLLAKMVAQALKNAEAS